MKYEAFGSEFLEHPERILSLYYMCNDVCRRFKHVERVKPERVLEDIAFIYTYFNSNSHYHYKYILSITKS